MKKMRAPTLIGAPTLESYGIESKDSDFSSTKEVNSSKSYDWGDIKIVHFTKRSGSSKRAFLSNYGNPIPFSHFVHLTGTDASVREYTETAQIGEVEKQSVKDEKATAVAVGNSNINKSDGVAGIDTCLVLVDIDGSKGDSHHEEFLSAGRNEYIGKLMEVYAKYVVCYCFTPNGLHLIFAVEDAKLRGSAAKSMPHLLADTIGTPRGAHYDLNVHDVKRLMFVWHDPNVYFNPAALPLTGSQVKHKPLSPKSNAVATHEPNRAKISPILIKNVIEGLAAKKMIEKGVNNLTDAGRNPTMCSVAGSLNGRYELDDVREAFIEYFSENQDKYDAEEITAVLEENFKRYDNTPKSRASVADFDLPENHAQGSRILFSDEIPDPTPIISHRRALIASEGNFIILGGKAKTKKSFLATLLCAAYFKPRGNLIGEGLHRDGAVLYIDCEMGRSHTHKIIQRVYQLCKWEDENQYFHLHNMREYSVGQRIEAIGSLIKENQPRLIVIDGIADICSDFNSVEVASNTVQSLMTWTSETKCAIIGILHENKSEDTKALKGHLGSLVGQKAETVVNLNPLTGGGIEVQCTMSRNIPFDNFLFDVVEGLPQEVEGTAGELNAETQKAYLYGVFSKVLTRPMKSGELCSALAVLKNTKPRTEERTIKEALGIGVLRKEGMLYSLNNLKDEFDEL